VPTCLSAEWAPSASLSQLVAAVSICVP